MDFNLKLFRHNLLFQNILGNFDKKKSHQPKTRNKQTMAARKPYKALDRTRSLKKGVMATSLEEFIRRGKEKLGYTNNSEVYAVLEEDGTEVDEDDYFQTLPNNTTLMLLFVGDR